MTLSFEQTISTALTSIFGYSAGGLVIGIVLLFAVNFFILVQRVPLLVAVLANGLLIFMLGMPIAYGGLGLESFTAILVLVFIVMALILYRGVRSVISG